MSRLGSSASVKALGVTIAFVFLFIVAILLDLPHLYVMAITIALLPLASYCLAWFFASKYTATREHPATTHEGRHLTVRLGVHSHGGLPQAAIRIGDALPEGLLCLDDARGFPDDWDGRDGTYTYRIEPQVRGVFLLGPPSLEMSDPLGLFGFEAELEGTSELVVHPTPLPARAGLAGGAGVWGVRECDGSTRRGEGLEFHGVREYRPGDPLRRVHWRTSARTGRLAVVEYERAYQQNLLLALDLARGQVFGEGRETTLEYAIKIAATLADRTLAAGGGVTLLSQSVRFTADPGGGDPAASRFALFDHLARARPESDLPLSETLRAAHLAPGSRLVVLTTGGDDALPGYLTERRSQGDQVTVYFLEPESFGGPGDRMPAVPRACLKVVERQHSPWDDGGRRLEYLLKDDL